MKTAVPCVASSIGRLNLKEAISFDRQIQWIPGRLQRALPTRAGQLLQVGATSASLHHEEPDRMAGFNLYEVDAQGRSRVEAWVYAPETGSFHLESVPKLV